MSVETKPGALEIAVVEDKQDSRESLEFLINHAKGMGCVAAVASAEEALQILPTRQPDVVLLDIHLAGKMDGVDCLKSLKERLPSAKIIMLTCDDNPDTVFSCLVRGAIGYLHKSLPLARLPDAIREAAEGGSPMSPEIARLVTRFFERLAPATKEWEQLSSREQQVLELLCQGLLKKEIADRLGISEQTVRSHCSHIYRKLHVNCREHAVAKVIPFDALPSSRPPKSGKR